MLSLLLVGCGKMGGALLARWRQQFTEARFDVIEPGHAPRNTAQMAWHKSLETLPQDYAPEVVVFAVKPQMLGGLLPIYGRRFSHAPLYLSIAAGKSLAFLAFGLGEGASIVRAMPNTPALAGEGMSVLTAPATLPASARTIATQLMQSVGKVEWVDESLMDAVTALSGSGPAYVFLFLDCLVKAGTAAGLPEGLAKTLAVQTVSGSLALAGQGDESFEQLRKNVTSPGGTTEAALAVLMKNDALEKLIKEAVSAAKRRSKEMAHGD